MRVVVDVQGAQSITHGERGIPRYIYHYARAVEDHHPGAVDAWLLEPSLPVPPSMESLLASGRLMRRPRTFGPPQLFHVLSPFDRANAPMNEMVPTWAQSTRTKLVVTLYDLIPLIYSDRYLAQQAVRTEYLTRLELVRNADLVLAISEATARDAVSLLGLSPRKVAVVGTGVGETFVPAVERTAALSAAQAAVPELRAGFVMYTGGMDFRKNIDGLLTAYAMLTPSVRAAHQLALVCRLSAEERDHLTTRAAALGIEDDLVLPGFVSDATLTSMYQSTELFVFPSLYEGFGLPVAEAQACGAPTIVSDNSSLVDLVSIPEARFDGSSASSIARALFEGLTDEDLRSRLSSLTASDGHVWRLVAERSLNEYERLLRRPVARPRRPRVAFVSPMPPAESGVADYSLRLVSALQELVDVTVFAQPGATAVPLPRVHWHTYREFDAVRATSGGFDRIVTAMGNSVHHFDVWEILRAHGGHTIAHDVVLRGFMEAAMALRPELVPVSVRETVARAKEGLLPAHLSAARSFDAVGYYRVNDTLIEPVVHASDRVHVHSRFAQSLARLEIGHSLSERVQVLPFGHPAHGVSAERQPQSPTVVSMGVGHHTKQSAKLCHAFVKAVDRVPGLTCVFVGALLGPAADEIADIIASAEVDDRVLVTGRVTDAEYRSWLARADLSVQLRDVSNGETSAAVADCLAAAVPVVVSDVGSNIELDASVAVHVDRTIDSSTLADVIVGLLDDDERLNSLARFGREHALRNSFQAAARELVADLLA